MIYEKYYHDGDCFMGWRCVNCGDVVDRVILENRGDIEIVGQGSNGE